MTTESDETVTMYMIVDDIDSEGRGLMNEGTMLLAFTSQEEANSFKRDDQKVLTRDGCPVALAISIASMSRLMLGKKELEGC